jgi:hypothetical protein
VTPLKAVEQTELLVLGSRGLSSFTGFLVGPAVLEAVACATRPVGPVRAEEDAEDEHLPADDGSTSTRTGYRHVALGIGLGDPCDEAIEFAFGPPGCATPGRRAATGTSLLVVGARVTERLVAPRTPSPASSSTTSIPPQVRGRSRDEYPDGLRVRVCRRQP